MIVQARAVADEATGWTREIKTVTVGIGELAIASDKETMLVTHALGSCIAVCIWDPEAAVAGMLHFLLPDAPPYSVRPFTQPGAFADTGIPLLFETAYRYGLQKTRAQVSLVGGAEMPNLSIAPRQIGKRNALAARRLLWANGVLVGREETGGTQPRTVYLCARTGRLRIRTGTTTS